MQTRRRHRVETRWQRSSIANLADDSVLHICALLSDPLCPRKSYKSIPAMSATCHGFHTLISPLLHSLRQTMRALHSLDGFVEHDLLIHVLRKPCLRFHGYRGENCAITPPCGSVFAQDSGEPIVSCPRDKAERMLAALLPLPALSHLRALVLGVAIVHDTWLTNGSFAHQLVALGLATQGAAMQEMVERRIEQQYGSLDAKHTPLCSDERYCTFALPNAMLQH